MHKSDFDEYFALRSKGMFREAYSVLCEILESSPRWSKVGDLYVWCAEFELLWNDDICKAQSFLERACELGYRHVAQSGRMGRFLPMRLLPFVFQGGLPIGENGAGGFSGVVWRLA